MTTTTHTAQGYRATRTDGELVVHRVPIFVECKRGDTTFDAEWITAAVAKAKQAEREGYLPPLHIRHHEPSTEATNAVRAAGYFRVLGADPITFKGARRIAIFAELTITDPLAQDDVLAKRLPYRSVEIFNVAEPSIDGLALLDHEAPFLQLPMLMVSDLTDATSVAGATGMRDGGLVWGLQGDAAVAAFHVGPHTHLLFREDDGVELETQADKAVTFADDGDKKDEPKNEEMEAAPLDVSSLVKAIQSREISVKDMDAILEAIQGARSAEEPEETPEEMPAPAAAPGEAMKASTGNDDLVDEIANLKASNMQLAARLSKRDEDDARKADVSQAMKRLDGRVLGGDIEDELVAFHADHGPKAFKTFVDRLVKTHPVVGDDDVDESFLSNRYPEVALKYQSEGTDAVDKAAQFAAEHDKLRNSGLTTLSLERYVEINMRRG